MSAAALLSELKKKTYKPVYWLEGEEEYHIDQVINFAEHHILSEAEAGFNLTVFYGKDAEWAEVVNACRRYPMFSEKQVVVLKEAQAMRSIEKLETYIEKPLSSTLLFIAYKNKKVDGRTRLAKLLKEKGAVLTTKKLYDNELPDFTRQLVVSKGLSITGKALMLLIDHIGNDLSRLNNEIDKLALNLNEKKEITEDDIERYVGISKEFNVFELQQALGARDRYKALRIIRYFAANPKAAPLQLVFPSLYTFFSKVLMTFAVPPGSDEKSTAAAIGVHPYFMKDYLQAARSYGQPAVENVLLLLHRYNLKSIGIDDPGTEDSELLKELVMKMMSEP